MIMKWILKFEHAIFLNPKNKTSIFMVLRFFLKVLGQYFQAIAQNFEQYIFMNGLGLTLN